MKQALEIALVAACLMCVAAHPSAAESDTAMGGNITVLNLTQFELAEHWDGYYGDLAIAGTPITGWASVGELSRIGNVTSQDLGVRCDRMSGYLLITNVSSVPSIASLAPGPFSAIDAIVGDGADSANRTFTSNSTFTIAGTTITDVPTVYTYVNSASQGTHFRQGYLTDGTAIVFVAMIESGSTGFDGEPHDFQFMLPRDPSMEWHIFALFDCQWCGDGTCGPGEDCSNCPEDCGPCEEEEEAGYGEVEGYIFPPEMLPCALATAVNLTIEVEKESIYVDEPLRGVVRLDYTGCHDIEDAILVIELMKLSQIANHSLTVSLRALSTSLEIPFAFNVSETGRHVVVARLEGAPEDAEGVTEVTAGVRVMERPAEHEPAPSEPEAAGPPQKAPAGCVVFGIDCAVLIAALLAVLAVLSLLLAAKRRRKERGQGKPNALARATKYRITSK